MLTCENWQSQLRAVARPEKIKVLSGFFKTGRGEYGEGDVFNGITVPDNRAISSCYHDAPYEVFDEMLDDNVHEFRLAALLALVQKYKKIKSCEGRETVVRYYLSRAHKANNWDLVDLSAPYILGAEVAAGRHVDDVLRFLDSTCLWEQRVGIVSMLTPARKSSELDLPYDVCCRMLGHEHQLIRKAVGWVLRELGKRDIDRLRKFLETNISRLSAVTLSYAVERMTPEDRQRLRSLRVDKK